MPPSEICNRDKSGGEARSKAFLPLFSSSKFPHSHSRYDMIATGIIRCALNTRLEKHQQTNTITNPTGLHQAPTPSFAPTFPWLCSYSFIHNSRFGLVSFSHHISSCIFSGEQNYLFERAGQYAFQHATTLSIGIIILLTAVASVSSQQKCCDSSILVTRIKRRSLNLGSCLAGRGR